MAKEKKARAPKPPGRIKQMVQVYQQTKRHDRNLTLWLLVCFLGPLLLSLLAAYVFNNNVFGWIVWPITGILLGVLIAMIVLGRRAESVAYRQLEGQPGAVGAVINGALRRSWRGSEVPVAMNRHKDAVYRVVGRGGAVLLVEGSPQRAKQLVTREETQLRRALSGVPVTTLHVGVEEDQVPLHRLSRTLVKLKPALNKREVQAVFNRLSSMKSDPVGIPKGMDPYRARAGRPR
ncbi:DUF4191 domain-containing protein [Leucobacter weissii]|uniref:DUF4191 domain-containing protein n=1 Tax=Leucobacter weissii TaxID=1983706 RepID=A0A939MJU3_9MICO|nr:DUF4191 domain-containing protein [Leucobacter weissii]MBO1901891.1 DUF4191 domain-containing protein [Leucobacter weissii]